MGRAKLKLELIPKEKARNLTFKKRKEGIMKKIREFTTLCDVNACMIIYGPNNGSEPVIWPDDRSEVERMIHLYKEKGSDNTTRAFGLTNFFMAKKKKLEDDVKKLKQKNLEAKYPTCVDFLDRLPDSELQNFVRFLNGKIEASISRLEIIGEIKEEEEQQQNQELQHLQGCYGYNKLDNLGFVNPLQQIAYNPNAILDELIYTNPTAKIIPAAPINDAQYGYNENLQIGYRQQHVNHYEPVAQYYYEPVAVAAPQYIGGDIPPLPQYYLELNEVKSACALPAPPQISGASYYSEEGNSNASTFPAIGGGGPPPQMAAYYSEENQSVLGVT